MLMVIKFTFLLSYTMDSGRSLQVMKFTELVHDVHIYIYFSICAKGQSKMNRFN